MCDRCSGMAVGRLGQLCRRAPCSSPGGPAPAGDVQAHAAFRGHGRSRFTAEASEIGGGDWQVLFRPSRTEATEPTAPTRQSAEGDWPEPALLLDLSDLDPPEPMVRTLAATEEPEPGEVVSALLRREPMFLFPELATRGHAWRGASGADGASYRIFVWVGAGKGPAT